MLRLTENSKSANELFDTLKSKIKSKVDKFENNRRFKLDRETINITIAQVPLLNFLKDENNIKEIITCKPSEFRNKISNWLSAKPNWFNESSIEFKILKSVFLSTGYSEIDKLKFINNIGLGTCPYCNRSYIYTLDRDKNVKPELDHFYPSSIYPIFASSYYNLIPSCELCNGINCKHNEDSYNLSIINPYLIEHKDFKFKYKLNKLSKNNPISGNLDIEISFENPAHPNIELFKLNDLYQIHKDHVAELIMKAKFKYNDKYRAYLRSYINLRLSEAEIDSLIVGNYTKEEEFHKRPLAKLYTDVSRQLGLIK